MKKTISLVFVLALGLIASVANADFTFGTPIPLANVNMGGQAWASSISSDGLSLYFTSNRAGGYGGFDIWMTNRATPDGEWGAPINPGPVVNRSGLDVHADISADGLALFFQSEGSWGLDLWIAKRADISDPFGPPVNIRPMIEISGVVECPNTSADGRTLFFTIDTSLDIWQVSILPVVDFNGDEIVDIGDLVKLIEHWGQDEPSVDIGPMPWGDGKVDQKDLEVLMSYWQQEILPLSLLAYWKLDETEGSIAQDRVGDKDGTLNGNPIWQPTSGKVDGALQLDGLDDYVSTPFVLNPRDEEFSVFAWIKCGSQGQVIISQIGGVNWLLADPAESKLMTELQGTGRGAAALMSNFVITDGVWHRIGFVWDGSQLILYVDDVEVAKDTRGAQQGSTGGLHIGAGKNLEPGSFFSGLIDDVRIYSAALRTGSTTGR